MEMLNPKIACLTTRVHRRTADNMPSSISDTPCTVGTPMEGSKKLLFECTQSMPVGQP